MRAQLAGLASRWLPAPVAVVTAPEALHRVAGASARQGLASLAIVAGLGALAWWRGAAEWLALFGVLLAPVLGAALAAQACRLLPPMGWRATWCLLLLAIAGASTLAIPVYRDLAVLYGFHGLGDGAMLACALGFALLLLALPLWQLQSQSAALRLAALEQAALAAELKALQAQIEPHFLYNTLANTRYLVRHDADKAVRMLDHLIAYLRSALPDMRGATSTLAREFELAEHYLALMAIRFGERLSFELDCPPALAGASLPPLMLMTLVENAVRHGVEPMPGVVRVRLCARAEGATLHLLVSDSGAGAASAVLGSGVGLRNLRARLHAMYGDAASFSLHIRPGADTEAALALPLEGAA